MEERFGEKVTLPGNLLFPVRGMAFQWTSWGVRVDVRIKGTKVQGPSSSPYRNPGGQHLVSVTYEG